MNPERIGAPCAVGIAGLAATGLVWATLQGVPHPEGLLACAALVGVKLGLLHRDAARPSSTIGDRHWREAVKAKLPEMIRGAKGWGAQIMRAEDKDAEIASIAPPETMTSHSWGVEVDLWPPEGVGVPQLQNGTEALLTALQKPLTDMGEPLALIDIITDPARPGRARLRILPEDPFANPRRWDWDLTDGPMGDRLGYPLAGFDRYGGRVILPSVGQSIIIGGIPGSGKSTGGLVHYLRQFFPTQAAIIGVDTVGYGVDLLPMAPRLAALYTDNRDVLPTVEALNNEREARVRVMVANGMTKLETDEDFLQLAKLMGRPTPPIIFAADEAHDAFPLKSPETEALKRIIKEGRKAGIWVIFATQRLSHNEIDTSLRALFAAGICFKVANLTDAEMVLGKLPQGLAVGPWSLDPKKARGTAYVKGEDTTGGAIGAGGLVAVQSLRIDVGTKRRAYPEVAASAVATSGRAPRLPWLPTPRGLE